MLDLFWFILTDAAEPVPETPVRSPIG